MTLYHAAVCCTVGVVLAAQEALDDVDVGLAGALHLADLHDPLTLELFGCGLVPGVGQAEGVVKPLAAQLPEQGALADAGRAVEHEHGVEFAARLQHTLDGSDEGLASHGPGVGGVLGAQIVDQQRVHPGYAVPLRQRLDVFPQGVEVPVVGHFGQCRDDGRVGEAGLVDSAHVCQELRVVGVSPGAAVISPRQWSGLFNGLLQIVVGDALEALIVLHDQHGVDESRTDLHLGVTLQQKGPVLRGLLQLSELLASVRCLLARGCSFAALVISGHVGHGLVAQGVLAALVFVTIVQMPELVEADQVEGIAELSACRVGAVIGIGEHVAVIDHEAGSS